MESSRGGKPAAEPRTDDRLEGSVMSRMILAMNLIVKPFVEDHAKGMDITLPEWRVMMALAAVPDRSGEEIARSLHVDRMTVSRALRRLEDHRRTVRRKDESDRKKNLWRLTPTGWKVFDTLAPTAEHRQAQVLSGLSAKDREALARALETIIGNAQ